MQRPASRSQVSEPMAASIFAKGSVAIRRALTVVRSCNPRTHL